MRLCVMINVIINVTKQINRIDIFMAFAPEEKKT